MTPRVLQHIFCCLQHPTYLISTQYFHTMTFEDLRLRHSVRSYSTEPLDSIQIKTLNAVITDINTHQQGLHFQLVTDSDSAMSGFTSSYGLFKNARNYIACVADTSFANYVERCGYFGMQVLMRAFTLGLGTCFVSGSYNKHKVDARVRVGEELVCLIVIGKEKEDTTNTIVSSLVHKIQHRHKSLTPMDFLDTNLSWDVICNAFPGLLRGLEGVSYAPSAKNKQPVGILIKKTSNPYNPVDIKKNSSKKLQHQLELSRRYNELLHSSHISENDKTKSNQRDYVLQAYVPAKNKNELLDLGIAMYNFQVGYPGEWEWGNPATFIPD